MNLKRDAKELLPVFREKKGYKEKTVLLSQVFSARISINMTSVSLNTVSF